MLFFAGQFKNRLHMTPGNNQRVSITDWKSIKKSRSMPVPSNKAFSLLPIPKQIAKDTTDHGLDVSNELS